MFQYLWMMFPIGLIGLIVSTILIAFHDMCSSINPPPISDYYDEDTRPNQTVFIIFLISSTMSLFGCCFYY